MWLGQRHQAHAGDCGEGRALRDRQARVLGLNPAHATRSFCMVLNTRSIGSDSCF